MYGNSKDSTGPSSVLFEMSVGSAGHEFVIAKGFLEGSYFMAVAKIGIPSRSSG